MKDPRAAAVFVDPKNLSVTPLTPLVYDQAFFGNNPHRYKGTPLEKVLPVETKKDQMPPEVPRAVSVMSSSLAALTASSWNNS